jgi:serine protease Do
MEGESVIALGNAYGYEQTVTRGIISALGREVDITDKQTYDNLIQTDASINPGNSGGPLLNIDGEMIGVNVAVRAGAQGIGFAIPVDHALAVATRLFNIERLRNNWHGLVTQAGNDPNSPLQVTKVETASPAQYFGLQAGDEIIRVGALHVVRPLDVERAFLDLPAGKPVAVEVRRGSQTFVVDMTLGIWNVLGLKLTEMPRESFEKRNTRFRGGMYVAEVRPNSPAAEEGIQPGDILVGMHKWETASGEDVQYILSRTDLADLGDMKFYVLRGERTLYGHVNVAARSDATAQLPPR